MREFFKSFFGALTAAVVIIGYFEYTAHRTFEAQQAQLSKLMDDAVATCDVKQDALKR